MTVAIAIGSTIFHTVATRGAILLDIIPIAIFLAGYLVLVWRRYLKFGMVSAITALAIFEVISFTLPSVTPPGFLNRSVPYLPALLMLIVVAAMVQGKGRARTLGGGDFALALDRGRAVHGLLFSPLDRHRRVPLFSRSARISSGTVSTPRCFTVLLFAFRT